MTATIKQARHSQFKKGSGTFACRCCTRKTRNVGDNGDLHLCEQCFELSGFDNTLSDRGPDETRGRYGDTIKQYLQELAGHVGTAKTLECFPELSALVLPVGEAIVQAPQATEKAPDVTPAAPTLQERAKQASRDTGELVDYLVTITGEGFEEVVMPVEASCSYHARRVAKRLVKAERPIDGLTFSARRSDLA